MPVTWVKRQARQLADILVCSFLAISSRCCIVSEVLSMTWIAGLPLGVKAGFLL